ncbi:MAG: hypothetical protein IJY47_05300 [Clostridia bacterium]|nr:hypothetical protein [Clostridia bacterium]
MDFKHVPNQYRPVPFWSWNEKLDTAETREQIAQMQEVGIGGFFMHARGGLQTEYMGEEWFENVGASVDEAKKRGMHAWAYDENGWPSGFGNGMINAKGVAYQQKYLRIEAGEGHTERTIANVGEYHLYFDVNPFYVDTLDGKVIKCFIDQVYEVYYEKYKNEIDGFFTDEPQISRNGIPWSFILPEEYQKAYGVDLIPLLPELFYEIGNYKRTRLRYWKLITELFSKNYMKQIYDWCEARGLKLTGHLLLEETLLSQLECNGACMPHYEYFHIPGMDWLGRHNNPSLTPYQVGSVARQTGKSQVLSETYACCGHSVGHDQLKWIYEYQMVRGINLLCQHLEGYSNRGLRKRDYPPAMYIQQPWWKDYKVFNDAMSRIGMLLSGGDDGVDTLVIHPQTTAWITYNGNIDAPEGQSSNEATERVNSYSHALQALLLALEQKHINFHLGDEIMMERYGRIEDGHFVIGKKSYRRVILPEHEIFFENTERLLEEFRAAGGEIVEAKAVSALPSNPIIDIPQITYCQRSYEDYDVYYFVNSTEDTYLAGITVGNRVLDPVTGELSDFAGTYEFKKYESLVLIDDRKGRVPAAPAKTLAPVDLSGEWKILGSSENSLTLDYCDYYFDGELEEAHGYILNAMYRAIAREKKTHITMVYTVEATYKPETLYLGVELPQLFDITVNGETVDKTDCGYFRDKSFRKLDISKHFRVGENKIVLDIDFEQSQQVYDNLAKAMQFESEKNKLTFDCELEQIYLIGDFAVEGKGSFEELERDAFRFTGVPIIAAPRKSVTLKNIEQQGFLFFAGELTLSKKFTAADKNLMLDFEKKGINVVRAKINGTEIGKFLYEPYRADLSPWILEGENELTLTLVGNLRNMQGPFHLSDGESPRVSPANFYKEKCVFNLRVKTDGTHWNDDYCLIHLSLSNRT